MEEASPEIDNEEVAESESTQESDKTEANEWKDKYIRLYAEFENYKKRTLKEKQNLYLMAAKKLLQQFFLFSMILSVHLPIKLKIRPQLKKVSSSFIRSF